MTASSPRFEGSTRRSRPRRPLGVAIAAIVLGIAGFGLIAALPESSIPTAFSPQWWPQVLAAALVALGLAGLVKALFVDTSSEPASASADAVPDESWSIVRVSAVLGATLLSLIIWQSWGYLVATALYTIGLSALLGARNWRGLLLFPAVVTASLVLFFDTLLGVPL